MDGREGERLSSLLRSFVVLVWPRVVRTQGGMRAELRSGNGRIA